METTAPTYALKKTLALAPDEAEARVRTGLADEGFGILTEIDVRQTLREKLDTDFRPYRILGACNPPLSHEALSAETDIGLLLPCNVVVYAGDEAGTSVVAAIDPVVQLGVTGMSELATLAGEVKERLERVLAAL